jgi:predicted CoA-substrate-specific enzyme activase
MVTAGIDTGSLTTKAAIVGNGKVIAHEMVLTGDSSYEAATRAVEAASRLAGVDTGDITGFVSTGAGKGEIPYTNEHATELLCDARGAQFYYPSARTIIDVGAENVRVIRCGATGRVLDFGLNDKCASGTGIFLDTMARALEVRVEDLGLLSLQAREDITITATCAVFAESEVVGLIAKGTDKASILGGIHKSIASRIYGLVIRLGINRDVALIGGGAKNSGLSTSLEGLINQEILIPEHPQIVGAVGAALIAEERNK